MHVCVDGGGGSNGQNGVGSLFHSSVCHFDSANTITTEHTHVHSCTYIPIYIPTYSLYICIQNRQDGRH